ncbi:MULTISPECIES: hypothetical protein [unclassified Novosphingobium]|uniref:hypothetical protein n=1 Tax=Novosphingobium TaxID=165696 RepID=UPI0014461613|nr:MULTISPECIES: hypothetical protein [unclassified Novosphingobium]NKJ43268.1 phosphoenolpyruvate carboxylase [Novosphingobium sp. SG720]NMN07039.1 phosphoenolpyruvate carboxylase [Novosphingobium sp. SG919]NMN89373.1 phosphoenolpyruvate carboxylase [Novosphingobium sp. SG916]
MKLLGILGTAALASVAIAAPAHAAATRAGIAAPVQAVQAKMLKRSSQAVSTRNKNVSEELLVAIPVVATGVLIAVGNSNDDSPGG